MSIFVCPVDKGKYSFFTSLFSMAEVSLAENCMTALFIDLKCAFESPEEVWLNNMS